MKATPGFATALEMLLQKKPDGLFMDDNLIGIAPQLRRTTPQKTVIFIQDDGTGTVIKIPTTTTEVYANSAANIWVW